MKVVALHSGGLDSSVLLFDLLNKGVEVLPVGVYYGQRHQRELHAALLVTTQARNRFGTLCREYSMVDLSSLKRFMTGSSQTDENVAVPHGHFEHESMKATIVPNRNMILLAVAGAIAIANKCSHVSYANHAGDHAIYPDCRPDFVAAMSRALLLADWHEVGLESPYKNMTKADIVTRGAELGVPMGLTYSCYEGLDKHCGLCGTCMERREAFQIAKVRDQTDYTQPMQKGTGK